MNRLKTRRLSDSTRIRVATTVEDFETAFRIAYEVYEPCGFIPASPLKMRGTARHLRPSTVVLLATLGDEPVGTLSVYADGPSGIPLDVGWKTEIDGLRKQGKKVMEFGSLMVLPSLGRRGRGVCLTMFRYAWLYARAIRGANAICAFARPQHAKFYKRVMNFNVLGRMRCYTWYGLNFPECVPLWMNLDGAEQEFKNRYERHGDSPKNLYRFFAQNGRERVLANLNRQVDQLQKVDFARMHAAFDRLLNPNKSTAAKVVEAGEPMLLTASLARSA